MDNQRKIEMFKEELKIAQIEYAQLNELYDIIDPRFNNSMSYKLKAQEEYIKELLQYIRDLKMEVLTDDIKKEPSIHQEKWFLIH